MVEVSITQNFVKEYCKTPVGWYWKIKLDEYITLSSNRRYSSKSSAKKASKIFCKKYGFIVDRMTYSQIMV